MTLLGTSLLSIGSLAFLFCLLESFFPFCSSSLAHVPARSVTTTYRFLTILHVYTDYVYLMSYKFDISHTLLRKIKGPKLLSSFKYPKLPRCFKTSLNCTLQSPYQYRPNVQRWDKHAYNPDAQKRNQPNSRE